VPVFPVGAYSEQPHRLYLAERHLVLGEGLGGGQLTGSAGLPGALSAGAIPAEQLEGIDRLVPVRPLNAKQLPGAVSQDVERALAILGVRNQEGCLGGFFAVRLEDGVEVLPVGYPA
jgi:hypothetical protein